MVYHKHYKNSCFMSSLASDFKALDKLVAADSITTLISALLKYYVHATPDRIKVSN